MLLLFPKYRVKGATLSEMLVVIALTVVVTALAFSVLFLVQRQLIGMERFYVYRLSISRVDQVVSKDLYDAKVIKLQDRILQITTLTDTTVNYRFQAGNILRNADTLYGWYGNVRFLHKGKPVHTGHVDAIELKLDSIKKGTLFFAISPTTISQFPEDGL